MTKPFRIALTADLHYGIRPQSGDRATHRLIAHLAENPPDLMVLAGDIGSGDHFAACLALFDQLECQKALVPGNHDVWVTATDARGNSLEVYRGYLPRIGAEHDFHYLDQEPLIIPAIDLAVVGSMNWYDYSWSLDRLKTMTPDWQNYLTRKCFTRGQHNDKNYVRWPLSDEQFTQQTVGTLDGHLQSAASQVRQTIVVTHHPPLRALNYPRPEPLALDDLLWQAFSGNQALETLLHQRAQDIAFAFCGHTHFAVNCDWHGIHGYNIGGDYHFKRLLMLDWPARRVEAIEFFPD